MVELTLEELSEYADRYKSSRLWNVIDNAKKMGYHKVHFRNNDLSDFTNELNEEMMNKYIDKISAVLYDYDFMMTGCKENPDMLDEYEDVAYELLSDGNKTVKKEDLQDAFDNVFGSSGILEDMGVSEKTLNECTEKIMKILNSSE